MGRDGQSKTGDEKLIFSRLLSVLGALGVNGKGVTLVFNVLGDYESEITARVSTYDIGLLASVKAYSGPKGPTTYNVSITVEFKRRRCEGICSIGVGLDLVGAREEVREVLERLWARATPEEANVLKQVLSVHTPLPLTMKAIIRGITELKEHGGAGSSLHTLTNGVRQVTIYQTYRGNEPWLTFNIAPSGALIAHKASINGYGHLPGYLGDTYISGVIARFVTDLTNR